MTIATDYRTMAQQQRSKAKLAALPLVREQLLSAAERWDWLANEAEAMNAGLEAMFETTRRTAH